MERYWRVTFTAEGKPDQAVEIDGGGAADWIVVQAESADEALRISVRAYARLKKRKVKARMRAEGRCVCGRKQDREHPKTGQPMLTCSVCAELHRRHRQPKPENHVRDEGARVLAFQETSRNRKQEVRLEVLLEVRAWWRQAAHTAAFAQRLASEIQEAGGRDKLTG